MKWKHFPRNWPFVRGIHRSPVNSTHKGQWRGASMFSLICVWINDWVNKREAGDLRCYHAHYDVTVMDFRIIGQLWEESTGHGWIPFTKSQGCGTWMCLCCQGRLNKLFTKQASCERVEAIRRSYNTTVIILDIVYDFKYTPWVLSDLWQSYTQCNIFCELTLWFMFSLNHCSVYTKVCILECVIMASDWILLF